MFINIFKIMGVNRLDRLKNLFCKMLRELFDLVF